MNTLGIPDDTPIEHALISRSIEKAQKKVEQYYFSIRKQILEYDDVINKQRESIYKLRKQILKKQNQDTKIEEFVKKTVNNIVGEFFQQDETVINSEAKDNLISQIQTTFSTNHIQEMIKDIRKTKELTDKLSSHLYKVYLQKKAEHPAEIFSEIVKEILLMNLDRKWMDHLHNIDVLKEGIGLRAYGQRDPLMEYKIESFDLFTELLASIARETIETINKISIVEMASPPAQAKQPHIALNYSSSKTPVQKSQKSEGQKVGRNDPCPCGSGKKYKKCCMK